MQKAQERPKEQKSQKPKPRSNAAPAPSSFKPGTSYAGITKGNSQNKKEANQEPLDFHQALKQMQMMYSAMSAFFANIPSMQG